MSTTRHTEDAIRLNLSYVLHEPSTSPATNALARYLLSSRQRIATATRRLDALPDLALLPRVVPRDLDRLWSVQADPPHVLLTLRLGAWPLLARVLALHLSEQVPRPAVHLLDDRPRGESRPLLLFRAHARLALPPPEVLAGRRVCFATVVFRPGWHTLLLDLAPFASDPSEDWEQWTTALASAAEAALREFTDQWLCSRPLWTIPAEEALPEFDAEGI
jgi:lauroyl/myristoyl acyltransferase